MVVSAFPRAGKPATSRRTRGPAARRVRVTARIRPLDLSSPDLDRPFLEAAPAGERARFLSHANAIAAELREHAAEAQGGAVTWQAPPAREGGEPRRLGFNLYDGVLGIALFLAARDHAEGRDDYRDLVLRALAPPRRALRALARAPETADRVGLTLGGFTGLGSFLYAFVRIAGWIGEPALVREAHDLTLLLTRDRIARDERLDLVDGCAGAIPALLALDDVAPEPNAAGDTPLALAAACASHLLERRVWLDGRPRAWAAAGRPPLGGFAHGAAGVGHALLRLFARTGDEALRQAALEGFAFERSLFDPPSDNWLDPRTGRLLEQSAWCHGAPGMALGRAASLGVHSDAGELETLVRLTRAVPDRPLDHLCCGNLGRAEILLALHQALGRRALLADARALAERTVRRAEYVGAYALVRPGEAPGLRPAFFHGVAGVGYALLRLAAPRALPCILRME